VIRSAELAVDSFYFLSGLLATLGLLRLFTPRQPEISANPGTRLLNPGISRDWLWRGVRSVPLIYLKRFLRIAPLYMLAFWFYVEVNRFFILFLLLAIFSAFSRGLGKIWGSFFFGAFSVFLGYFCAIFGPSCVHFVTHFVVC
jgi:hypothetical protein